MRRGELVKECGECLALLAGAYLMVAFGILLAVAGFAVLDQIEARHRQHLARQQRRHRQSEWRQWCADHPAEDRPKTDA